MIEKKLRTCPFCRADAQIIRVMGVFPPRYVPICSNSEKCGAAIRSYSLTKAEAANKWNFRPSVVAAHEGCRYCPVKCNKYERDTAYRGSFCAAARAKAGVDYDPESVFAWEADPPADESGKEVLK